MSPTGGAWGAGGGASWPRVRAASIRDLAAETASAGALSGAGCPEMSSHAMAVGLHPFGALVQSPSHGLGVSLLGIWRASVIAPLCHAWFQGGVGPSLKDSLKGLLKGSI